MSNLLFLGFSVIVFFLVYGIAFTIIPMVLGAFYSLNLGQFISDADWLQAYNDLEDTTRWIIVLIPTIGITLAVLKIFMVATAKGRD